jgi:hypothetical protein
LVMLSSGPIQLTARGPRAPAPVIDLGPGQGDG